MFVCQSIVHRVSRFCLMCANVSSPPPTVINPLCVLCCTVQVKQLDELERLLEGERQALQREREDVFLLRTQAAVQSYNNS